MCKHPIVCYDSVLAGLPSVKMSMMDGEGAEKRKSPMVLSSLMGSCVVMVYL